MFKVRDGYNLELQMPETIKLFGSTIDKTKYVEDKIIDKTKYVENVANLEMDEVVLVQCSLVDNQYQQKSEVLYFFTPKLR